MHENDYSDHRSDRRDYRILRLEVVAIAKLRTRAPMYPSEKIFDLKRFLEAGKFLSFPTHGRMNHESAFCGLHVKWQ